jgi:phosphoglycolate phosphatase
VPPPGADLLHNLVMPQDIFKPRRYDLIAFDWDGTLFDSTAIIVKCIQRAVADVGGQVPSDKDAAYVIGMGLMQALAYAAPSLPPDKYPALGERYRHHYAAMQHELTLFEGVMPMLAMLKQRNHWLAVATGKSRRGLDDVFAHVSMKGVFDTSRTADETAGKPSPLMMHQIMRELGVEPERCLVVGDTTHDLQMAINAGCDHVAVTYGAHDEESLRSHRPVHVADSVAQLHRWLEDNA